jgi:hypothetical protein
MSDRLSATDQVDAGSNVGSEQAGLFNAGAQPELVLAASDQAGAARSPNAAAPPIALPSTRQFARNFGLFSIKHNIELSDDLSFI